MNDLNQITETADKEEAATQAAIRSVREAFFGGVKSDTVRTDWRPSECIEALRLARDLINAVATSEHADEVFDIHTCGFRDEAFGKILKEMLPRAECGCKMNIVSKNFWLLVADELGPDWVESFRMVGAFMKRVDSF